MKNLIQKKSYLVILSLLLTIFFQFSISAKSVVVTNTKDNGSGSLRQAISDANSNTSIDSIIFEIPTTDAGYDATTGVFRIEITGSALTPIYSNGLVIDATTQTSLVGNTNTAVLGSGMKVGVDQVTIPKVDAPEIEIVDGNNLSTGLVIHAHYVTIKGLSIYGFGNQFSYNADANILIKSNYTHFIIEKNIIGSGAAKLERPSSFYENKGNNLVGSYEASHGIIKNNIIAYATNANVLIFNPDSTLIQYNEIFNDCFADKTYGKGILITCGVSHTIQYNYIYNNPAEGIDAWDQTKFNEIVNNTIVGNGRGGKSTAGIRQNGADYSYLIKNIIAENYGAGVMMTSGAYHITISKNSIFKNGCIQTCDNGTRSYQIGIDNLSNHDLIKTGTYPFESKNDSADWDAGGNTILNSPVIESANIDSNGKLTIKGFSRPQTLIEFFIADKCDSFSCGQGKTYLFSATEGSGDDLDASVDYYCDCPIGGHHPGHDKTTKFKFVVNAPSNLKAGDIINATATYDRNTSEFSCGTEVTSGRKPIYLYLYCMLENQDSSYTAIYSYENLNNDTIEVPYGYDNMIKDGPQNAGQPTKFYPGVHHDVFRYNFKGSSVTWKVLDKTVTTYPTSYHCKVDVGVEKYVDSPVVDHGDTVTFTIIAKNLSSKFPTSKFIVMDTLTDSLQLISWQATRGTYNATTGEWLIGELPSDSQEVLTIKAIVWGNSDNCALVVHTSQKDYWQSNDKSCVSVQDRGSSGGNDGGVESNGTLASKIALRNYKRISAKRPDYNSQVNLQPFTRELAEQGIVKASSILRNQTDLVDFIPDHGPYNTTSFVTTPTDLLGITNAVEIFSVDYFNQENIRYGAIYAVATNPKTVYDHTKLVCDRVNGATLVSNDYIYGKGYPFIINKLVQDNGEVDYAVSFVAYDVNGKFIVDNKWQNEDYSPIGNNEVYNFQVWSASQEGTEQLLNQVLDLIGKKGSIDYINKTEPDIPQVYVENGYYSHGKLYLNIYNELGATRLNLRGTSARVENGERTYFDTDIEVPLSGAKVQQVVFETGHIFDVGLAVRNDVTAGVDVIYFADGPWGVDTETGRGTITSFEVFPHDSTQIHENAFQLERNVAMTGTVKDYLVLFRSLRVGNKPVDLSMYKQLEFEAKGKGTLEVIIAKKGIKEWKDQYYKVINLGNEYQLYTIKFEDLMNSGGIKGFTAEDVISVVFNILGDKTNFTDVELDVKNAEFNARSVSIDDQFEFISNSLTVYPNPVQGKAMISFNLPEQSQIVLDLVDLNGKLVEHLSRAWFAEGKNQIYVDLGTLSQGVYMVNLKMDNLPSISKQIIIVK